MSANYRMGSDGNCHSSMKTVLLIGGPGSTIGRNLLKALVNEGHYVVTTRYSESDAGEVETECGAVHTVDITDEAAVRKLVSTVDAATGGIDVLINNAGISEDGLLSISSSERWRRVIDVNLLGTYHSCKYVARKMMARRTGSIINMASRRAGSAVAGGSAYAASKAGVIALTRCLAAELAEAGVYVNAVCPGFVPSRINRFDEGLARAESERALLGLDGCVNDVTSFVCFLCSGLFSGVTGQVFELDSRVS